MDEAHSASGLAPLFVFLALLLFALLGWLIISSCLGQSLSDLWHALVLSGQTGGDSQPWRRRRDWMQDEIEMEYRGRARPA